VAATVLPQEGGRRALAASFKGVPTGIAHGTITVVADGQAIEVTTLRDDVETDGRHARVVFGRDWARDAERRDFTINALYADPDGTVLDLVGGLDDIAERRLRFIGDAGQRIREDYLRILRFFRFFAWYGSGRPDAEGVKACAREKEGLDRLSAERVWSELKKLLSAPDPSRALLWMRQAGVLSRVLPESEKWGIDAVHPLVAAERDLGWAPDPLLRLMAIVPPDGDRMAGLAARLKLSKAEAGRLAAWADVGALGAGTTDRDLARRLYDTVPGALVDRLKLSLATSRQRSASDLALLPETAAYLRLLDSASTWQRPEFPLRAADLAPLGLAGPQLGRMLRELEKEWADGGFGAGRDRLVSRAAELVQPPP